MAGTFKFHNNVNEILPITAEYSFPSQATKVSKQTVKVTPKNGETFTPGSIIRIDLPADHYLNTLNSSLALKVTLSGTGTKALYRHGVHGLFKRLRVLYGNDTIEDIQDYSTLVRIFHEHGIQQDYASSTGTILDGMSASSIITPYASTTAGAVELNAGTAAYIDATNASTLRDTLTAANGLVRPQLNIAQDLSSTPRNYNITLMSGILNLEKLLPVKWMAAQITIELTLNDASDCLLSAGGASDVSYSVSEISYVAEMLEFDGSYDEAFKKGISENGGIPLKFSSFHYHTAPVTGFNQTFQFHERARSLKNAYACIIDKTATTGSHWLYDSKRFFHALGSTYNNVGQITSPQAGEIEDFQWRLGGSFYPAQPVVCTGGAPEALQEIQKALNTNGDYTRASNVSSDNFTANAKGGGSTFVMACEFENTDAMPNTITGINAEEQSDIALSINANPTGVISQNKVLVAFMHYDALLLISDFNEIDLIM